MEMNRCVVCGKDWKVLFTGKTSPCAEKETVLVGTSLKVPWLDLTPCKTIDLCGDSPSALSARVNDENS